MRVRQYNPEGEEDLLEPGDILMFTTDLPILAFTLPLDRAGYRGTVHRIINAQEGDIVQYVGVTFRAREFAVTATVPLYEFIFMPLDERGQVRRDAEKKEIKIPFLIKNVETILKWTEKLE